MDNEEELETFTCTCGAEYRAKEPVRFCNHRRVLEIWETIGSTE
jgi:hypothetical protein